MQEMVMEPVLQKLDHLRSEMDCAVANARKAAADMQAANTVLVRAAVASIIIAAVLLLIFAA
jgi:hypothetical protein